MAINAISTTVRNGMCDFFVDALDTGSTDASGDINIYNAAFALLLAELTFSAPPAFGAAAAGVATANAIGDDISANNTGTAALLRMQDRDNAVVAEGTVSTAGADLNLNTTSITAGDTVAITAATITMPAA